ncbi:MAG: hypothetical protein R3E01_05665 [Pirellulaceae bacterium]
METDHNRELILKENPEAAVSSDGIDGTASTREKETMWGAIVAIAVFAGTALVVGLQEGKQRVAMLFAGIIAAIGGGLGTQYALGEWPFNGEVSQGQAVPPPPPVPMTRDGALDQIAAFRNGVWDADAIKTILNDFPDVIVEKKAHSELLSRAIEEHDQSLAEKVINVFFTQPLEQQNEKERDKLYASAAIGQNKKAVELILTKVENPLHFAAMHLWEFGRSRRDTHQANAEYVKEMMNRFPDLMEKEKKAWLFAAEYAIESRDRETTDVLLKPFFAIPHEKRDQYAERSVYLNAAEYGDKVVRDRLVQEERVRLGFFSPSEAANMPQADATLPKSTQMHDAVNEGNLPEIKQLLAESPGIANTPDGRGYTPLHYAVRDLSHWEIGNVEQLVDILVSHDPKLATAETHDSEKLTPAEIIKELGYELEFPEISARILQRLEKAVQEANVSGQQSRIGEVNRSMALAIEHFQAGLYATTPSSSPPMCVHRRGTSRNI